MLDEQGVDADAVLSEIDSGGPIATVQAAHEAAAKDHHVWGVPTFILGDQAAFVRYMDRPQGDADRAIATHRAHPRPARRLDRAQRVQAHLDPALIRLSVLAFAAMAGPREMRNERRMTDVEALMWNLEKDPHLSSSIANVTLLDQAPDPERLRSRLAARRRAGAPAPAARGPRPRAAGAAGVARRTRLRPRLPPPLVGAAQPRVDAPAARPHRHVRAAPRSTAPGRCGSSSSSRASRTAAPR